MLYKVMSSVPVPYRHKDELHAQRIGLGDYWNTWLIEPPRVYSESATVPPGSPWCIWTGGGNSGNYGQYTYGLYWLVRVRWPSYVMLVTCWDSLNGDLLWSDRSLSGSVGVAWLRTFFQDLNGRCWSQSLFYVAKLRLRGPREGPGNTIGEQYYTEGMSVINEFDEGTAIYNTEWLDDLGVPLYGPSTIRVLSLEESKEVAFLTYLNNYNKLYMYSTTTKMKIGELTVPPYPYKMAIIDNNTAYLFHKSGTITLIDYERLKILGTVYMEPDGLNNFTVSYDPINRRIITLRATEDLEDGESTCRFEGWANRPVGAYLQKPITLKKPRVGNTVPVVTRCLGTRGEPIPGAIVKAVLEGPNSIMPASVRSDIYGWAKFYYTTNTEGTDIDDLEVSVDYEEGLPGLEEGIIHKTAYQPPSQIENDRYFHPGHWIYSSTATCYQDPSIKWANLLSDPDNGIVGVMQEYEWLSIEISLGVFDWTNIDRDLDWCTANGYKFMFALTTLEDRPPVDVLAGACRHPLLCQPCPEDTPPPCFAEDSGGIETGDPFSVTYMEISDVPIMQARLKTLISAICQRMTTNETWVGLMPQCGNNIRSDTNLRTQRLRFNSVTWDDVPIPCSEDTSKSIYPSAKDHKDGVKSISTNSEVFGGGRLCFMRSHDFVGRDITVDWAVENRLHYMTSTWKSSRGIAGHYEINDMKRHERTIATALNLAEDILVGDPPQYSELFGPVHRGNTWNAEENKNCQGIRASARELLSGGTNMADCDKHGITEIINPWFVFWPIASEYWDGPDGVYEVSKDTPLRKAELYLG